jgi:hypothetical protein
MPIPYGSGYTPPLAAGVYPQPNNVPPRFVIAISAPGSTTAVVYRSDSINGEDAVTGTVVLDAQGSATVYDYAASYGVPTTYTVVAS